MKPTAFAALLGLVSAVAMAAPPTPYAPIPVDTVVATLVELGMTPERKTDDYGDPLLTVTLSNGYKASVFFYDCAEDKCGSIQMHAGFTTDSTITHEKLNEWNSTRRWARGYKSSGGSYHLETDTMCTAQDQKGQVKVFVETFDRMSKDYAGFLGF